MTACLYYHSIRLWGLQCVHFGRSALSPYCVSSWYAFERVMLSYAAVFVMLCALWQLCPVLKNWNQIVLSLGTTTRFSSSPAASSTFASTLRVQRQVLKKKGISLEKSQKKA